MTDRFTDTIDMQNSVSEFLDVYNSRPIKENAGGMGVNHSWALWYVLRQVNPSVVVESGVWKGHSTWLIHTALPNAKIYSFDVSGKSLEKNKFKKSDLVNAKILNCREIESKLLFRLKPRY